MNYLKKRTSAVGVALSGLWQAFKSEPHLKLHGVAAVLVVTAGFYFSISQTEWIAVLGCITLVISLELINSAIEKLCNLVMPQQHPTIKYIKDVAAAAVLIACIFAVIVGLLVFRKYVLMHL